MRLTGLNDRPLRHIRTRRVKAYPRTSAWTATRTYMTANAISLTFQPIWRVGTTRPRCYRTAAYRWSASRATDAHHAGPDSRPASLRRSGPAVRRAQPTANPRGLYA